MKNERWHRRDRSTNNNERYNNHASLEREWSSWNVVNAFSGNEGKTEREGEKEINWSNWSGDKEITLTATANVSIKFDLFTVAYLFCLSFYFSIYALAPLLGCRFNSPFAKAKCTFITIACCMLIGGWIKIVFAAECKTAKTNKCQRQGERHV